MLVADLVTARIFDEFPTSCSSCGECLSIQLLQLLQTAQLARRLQTLAHDRPGHFADIDIAARVDGDAMRRDELAGLFTGEDIAQARQPLACLVVDIDAVAEIRRVLCSRPDPGPTRRRSRADLFSSCPCRARRADACCSIGFRTCRCRRKLARGCFPGRRRKPSPLCRSRCCARC